MIDSSSTETNVRVVTRVRPLLVKEKLNGEESCIRVSPDLKQVIVGKDRGFTFDAVFNQKSNQDEIYQTCVKDLVKNIFDGYNSTIFAYGQTGSGKTYTMGTFNQEELIHEEKGIVPRAVEEIFTLITEKQNLVKFTVTASFIEVYKEEVRDLLDPSGNFSGQDGTSIQIREDERGNTILCGVYEHLCENQSDLLECLEIGSANRVTEATQMNEHSSRSHCVFTVNVVQEWSTSCVDLDLSYTENSESDKKNEIKNVVSGKFHFVDLAGSERAHKTGNVGDRFKESIHINSGLLALGNVISALGDPKKKKISHIPYRESKITRILKDSLGGNARTLMICCISPTISNYDESLNSLKYANRARNIRNKPIVNHDHTTRQIVQMQSEIIALREQLSRQRVESNIPEEIDVEDGCVFASLGKNSVGSRLNLIQLQNLFLKAKDIISVQIKQLCKGNNEISYDLLNRIEEWVMIAENLQLNDFDPTVISNMDISKEIIVNGQVINASFKTNITKLKNDLVNDVDLHAHKSNQLQLKDENIKDLEDIKEEMSIEINSLRSKLKEYENRIIDQQRELTQCRRELRRFQQMTSNINNLNLQYNFSAAPQTSPMKDQDSNRRIKSVPISTMKDKKNHSSKTNQMESVAQRKIKSSPLILNPELMVSRFHAQSQFLITELENEDEVLRPQFDGSHDELNVCQRKISISDQSVNKACQNYSKISSTDQKHREETKSVFPDKLEEVLHTTDVYKKQIKISQLKLSDANQKLRDLSINIRLKEQLIKDLVKSAKDTGKINMDHEEKIKNLEIEKHQTNKELEKLQSKLLEFSMKFKDNESSEVKKVKEEYQRKMELAQKKLGDLQKKQKDTQKLAMITSNHEKKVNDLVITVDRLKQEQINMQKKLKLESDVKQKLEKDLQRDQERIKQLEIQNEQQQKVLKRKQEEIVAANRKLRRGSTAMSSSEAPPKQDDQKKWLDDEVEKIIQYKKQIEDLEVDLQKREEILQKRENLLLERSEYCTKSNPVELTEKKSNENTSTLSIERNNLKVQKQKLEDKLKSGAILTEKEERWISQLDEAIEALDEAIEYKNDCIETKQEAIRRSQMDVMMSREDIFVRLTQVGSEEGRQLLMRYFDKVIDLREILRKKELSEDEKDLQIEELKRLKDQLQRNMERQASEHDRRYTQLQVKLESEKQILLHQMANNTTEQQNSTDNSNILSNNVLNLQKELLQIKDKCNKIEKEAYTYKKTCREMKSKIRDWVLSGRLKADIDIADIAQQSSSNMPKSSHPENPPEQFPVETKPAQYKSSISIISSAKDGISQKSYDPDNYTGLSSNNNSARSSQIPSVRNNISTNKKSLVTYSSAETNSNMNYIKNFQMTKSNSNKKLADRSPLESISTSIVDISTSDGYMLKVSMQVLLWVVLMCIILFLYHFLCFYSVGFVSVTILQATSRLFVSISFGVLCSLILVKPFNRQCSKTRVQR